MWSRFVMSQVKHNSYFIVGMAVGLWVSLAVIPLEDEAAPCAASATVVDEFEPAREEKPLGAAGQPAGRAVQRPRYYSTELGMRGSLLTGVLSSEDALKVQVPALNRTLSRLQPALKFFITASAMSSVPGLANVVGFTDTREMLKPFHALKYLADNYLEEYDFFFLVEDSAFVNARRLTELVAHLSVSQDVYMGAAAPGDSQYCLLESGIILSNSVLRAVHSELEWCVRNSYSPHHHENLGRCVLHAAHTPCTQRVQGETYTALAAGGDGATAGGDGAAAGGDSAAGVLRPALADAVAARGAAAAVLHRLHAYVARVHLQRDRAEAARLRAYMWRNSARHPPGYRNATWPAGLRRDPGLAAPTPENRFSHLRWTLFNATHAFMPDELRAAAPLDAAWRRALAHVEESARAWALRRWPDATDAALVEGAWQWEPAAALRYRLLLRLRGAGGVATLRMVEVARALGAARLVPVRYVTESARVWLTLPVPRTRSALGDAAGFLERYEQVCLRQDKNTHLYVVSVGTADNATSDGELRAAVAALAARHAGATLEVLEADVALDAAAADEEALAAAAARAALAAVAARAPPSALLLLAPPHLEFNQEFLNRVRMNTIAGEQWFQPLPFARHAQYAHPRFTTPTGAKPQVHTGRFRALGALAPLLAVYRGDFDEALRAWRGGRVAPAAAVLGGAALRCVRAPEPGCVLAPRGAPCGVGAADAAGEAGAASEAGAARATCLAALQGRHFPLDLGARSTLAQLLLETQSEAE